MELRKVILLCNIFTAGFVIMALEIVGIRILASFFGYSVFVWGTVIGIILTSLSIGYWLGGILADKSSKCSTIYRVILGAALYLALSILAYPFLLESLSKWNMLLGLSLASIILLVPPSFVLAMVPPIATKAMLKKKQEGKTIGNVYALSNIGSILGVFITTFYFLPMLGSRATMIGCFASLLLFVLIGLWLERTGKKAFLVVLTASILLLSATYAFGEEKGHYTLIKTESVYNTIEIRESGGMRWLLLNGYPMSYKEKEEKLGLYFYDAMAVFPELVEKDEMLILGFATGTVAEKTQKYFPDVFIEGVEIDPDVVRLAREYFELREGEKLKVHAEDARRFLQVNERNYGIIFNNAINAKFIPFHLVTKEFFELASGRLEEEGVLVNYSFYSDGKTVLRDSIARTMCEVFQSVYYLDFPRQKVSLLFGFKKDTGMEEILGKISRASERNQNESVQMLFGYFENMEEFNCLGGRIITDDKNPIDQITLEQIT